MNHINQMRELLKWFRSSLNKSCSFDIAMKRYEFLDADIEEFDYTFWIQGEDCHISKNLAELVETISTLKLQYQNNMEVAA